LSRLKKPSLLKGEEGIGDNTLERYRQNPASVSMAPGKAVRKKNSAEKPEAWEVGGGNHNLLNFF